jgi:hypothetical protein
MDETATVRARLEAAGFHPPDEDVEALTAAYARMREMATLLFAVDDARYEVPALAFRPEPRHVDWW